MKNIITLIFVFTSIFCFSQAKELETEKETLVIESKTEAVVYIDDCKAYPYDVHPEYKLTFTKNNDGLELYVLKRVHIVDEEELLKRMKENCRDGQKREYFVIDEYILFSKEMTPLAEDLRELLSKQLTEFFGSHKK
jgi:hypothetical protein